MYKVTICVPIYGVEKYIDRCARSLFEQTFDNIEYIFVNDCTKDKSVDILNNVITRYPNRVKDVKIINHDKNMGLGCSRNTAVTAATGEFILHVDSDDYLAFDCVEKAVKKQLENNYDFVSIECADVTPEGLHPNRTHSYATKKEFLVDMINHKIRNSIWGRLIRRSLYYKNNIRVESHVNMSEDLQVTPRLLFFASKVAFVHEPLCFYECSNSNSYTSSFSEQKARQQLITLKVLEDFFKDKEECYKEAVNQRKFKIITDLCINCGKAGYDKSFYLELRHQITQFDHSYWKFLSIPKRFAFILKNYTLFCTYLNVCTKLI